MARQTALEKRIKRRIIAREQTFYVIISPGLESVCYRELKDLFPEKEPVNIEGGIEFSGSLRDCYIANLHLRTASRILMRLESFTASGFGRLEKKLGEIPWELYIKSDQPLEIIARSKKSRLIHTDAIAQRVLKSISARFEKTAADKDKPAQKIYIRAVNDRFHISLDSSGNLLYKRGIKTGGGRAPIRETIAAGALMLAGYNGSKPLIDPMCGSGTFSLEAAMIACSVPSGWYRTFAFEHWPFFRPGTYKDIRRSAEQRIDLNRRICISASDIDARTIDTLRHTISQTDFSKIISVKTQDFFLSAGTPEIKGLVIINPPYGLRLQKSNNNSMLFNRIIEKFRSDFPGWTIALISPFLPAGNSGFKFRKFSLFHGGLNLNMIIGKGNL